MMLKTVMLVSALAISAPVDAQDMATPTDTAQPAKNAKKSAKKAKREPVPVETAAPTQAVDAAPIAGAPVTDTTPAPAEQAAAPAPATQPATPPAEAVAATPPAATPQPAAPAAAAVTGASQIAQVVNTEFPTYDKNADTNLDRTEFSAWMVALKTASDPATKAADPATVKWVDGAFASADLDKSKSVSKDELTKYLSQGA